MKTTSIVGAWQQVCLALLYPLLALVPLAFRTVAVTAAIVTDVYRAALTACIYMSA